VVIEPRFLRTLSVALPSVPGYGNEHGVWLSHLRNDVLGVGKGVLTWARLLTFASISPSISCRFQKLFRRCKGYPDKDILSGDRTCFNFAAMPCLTALPVETGW
jgi:hypothetical protein